ncbi:MAG TPA: sigma-70 family RNA polymerase sigma factor [Gemmatimonadales bacterium]|nr:sigma-70 family RNA polymerase sigma factor [Gemmatimonadales bacterium]
MSRSDDAEALVTAHRASLIRYLARYTGDADLAEDLVQETYMRLLERPPADDRNPRAWLFTVATNLARDRARIEQRRTELVGTTSPAAPDDPARVVERAETRARVQAALASLTPRDRTALLMREEGFRHREIAEAIGATTQSVGTILARALVRLGRGLGVPTPEKKETR